VANVLMIYLLMIAWVNIFINKRLVHTSSYHTLFQSILY